MHIFIHLIILFIFVFALLMLNIPQIEHDNFLQYKLYIFVGIFIFEFLISLFTTIYRKCIVNLSKIAKDSLQSALIATIAYAVYNDLVWQSSPLVAGQVTRQSQNLCVSVLITAFIAIGYFVDIVLSDVTPKMNDCLNTIYPAKSK